MRQARARPGGGHVLAEEVLRSAGLLDGDGRADVAVAELGADHLVGLALLDPGDLREIRAHGFAGGRPLAHLGPVLRAPLSPSLRGVARRADVAIADLPALDFIRREELRAAPAAQRAGELPGEADRVAPAHVHAGAAGRGDEGRRGPGEAPAPGDAA